RPAFGRRRAAPRDPARLLRAAHPARAGHVRDGRAHVARRLPVAAVAQGSVMARRGTKETRARTIRAAAKPPAAAVIASPTPSTSPSRPASGASTAPTERAVETVYL